VGAGVERPGMQYYTRRTVKGPTTVTGMPLNALEDAHELRRRRATCYTSEAATCSVRWSPQVPSRDMSRR